MLYRKGSAARGCVGVATGQLFRMDGGFSGVGMTMSAMPRASRSLLNWTIAGRGSGSRRGGPLGRRGNASPELTRIQEAAARDVLDVGTVEEPSVASGIDALVAGAEPAGHQHLRWRPSDRPMSDSFSRARSNPLSPASTTRFARTRSPHAPSLPRRGYRCERISPGTFDRCDQASTLRGRVPTACRPLDDRHRGDAVRKSTTRTRAVAGRRSCARSRFAQFLAASAARRQWIGCRHQKMK